MADRELKISVIVPVYNEMQYLEQCVSSICNQTYKNLEIILVNDGSDIPCRELCDTYSKKDERIRVIHKENGGSLSARRRGIEEATGDYVAFVDSDDWIELDLYAKIAEVMRKNEPDMIMASNYFRDYPDGSSMKVYENDRTGYWQRKEFEKEVFPYFIKTDDFFDTGIAIAMTYNLFKTDFARKILQNVDDRIKTSEDYVFLMIALLEAESCATTTYRGYHYRSNIMSKTHTLKNMGELLQPVYETVDYKIDRSQYNGTVKSILKQKNIFHIYHAFMIKDYGKLSKRADDFLFPYSKAKKGSKIVVYGAGKLGKQIYGAIDSSDDYKAIGLVDKNWELYKKQGWNVAAPEEILALQYDYIIIAIVYANIKNQVKRDLLDMGVNADKIAEVDLDVLDEAHLPFGGNETEK